MNSLKLKLINGPSVITNKAVRISDICPSNHEEADTRMILHAANASENGMRKVILRTVDTDVVVIALGMFSSLNLTEL